MLIILICSKGFGMIEILIFKKLIIIEGQKFNTFSKYSDLVENTENLFKK